MHTSCKYAYEDKQGEHLIVILFESAYQTELIILIHLTLILLPQAGHHILEHSRFQATELLMMILLLWMTHSFEENDSHTHLSTHCLHSVNYYIMKWESLYNGAYEVYTCPLYLG
jgi:hypothetical protein